MQKGKPNFAFCNFFISPLLIDLTVTPNHVGGWSSIFAACCSFTSLKFGPRTSLRLVLFGDCAFARSQTAQIVPEVWHSKLQFGGVVPAYEGCCVEVCPPCPVHCSKSGPLMSALGQKRTKRHLGAMSALPPKADMDRRDGNV